MKGRQHMERDEKTRLSVDTEAELIDPHTGKVVDMDYRWNAGERRRRWCDGPVPGCRIRPLNVKRDEDY